ncbi:MAG: DUF975 family protein [Phycisphaerae bacterium]|nr:DUF975 family protein [Phycisphaerae bacterium]
MALWHCQVGGQRYGPVPLETLQAWATQGRLQGSDHVWEEGTPQWVAAAAVPGLGLSGGAVVSDPLVQVRPPGGTGGRTPTGQITAAARQALKGRWGLPIAACLVVMILNLAPGQVPVGGATGQTILGMIVPAIIGGAMGLGLMVLFLTFIRGGPVNIRMLLAGFKAFPTALGAYLLRALFVIAWTLPGLVAAAVIAGIGYALAGAIGSIHEGPGRVLFILFAVLAGAPPVLTGTLGILHYSQVFYLLADNPHLGAIGALQQSKQMMNGHKSRLLVLWLRLLPWALLCILVIPVLWVAPYIVTCCAKFYDDLQPPAGAAAAPTAPAGSPAA